jgi:hypothetical protein
MSKSAWYYKDIKILDAKTANFIRATHSELYMMQNIKAKTQCQYLTYAVTT